MSEIFIVGVIVVFIAAVLKILFSKAFTKPSPIYKPFDEDAKK